MRPAMLGRLCAALLVSGFFFGCSELPAIAEGECGNGIVEAPEDCDGFDRDGSVCRPPGESGACRWDCTRRGSAQNPCPTGFGCSAEGVCRRPSGELSSVSTLVPGDAETLLAGDFDGDGKQDIVARDPALGRGATKTRVHYYDDQAEHVRTWIGSQPLVDPTVSEITGDARADLVFSAGNLGVMAGEADGSLIPQSFPSYFLPRSEARLIPVSDQRSEKYTGLMVMGGRGSELGLYRLDSTTVELVRMVELDRGVEALAAEPAVGVVLGAPGDLCSDVVLSFRGDTELAVHSVCEIDPDTHLPRFRETAATTMVPLEPPAALSSGLLLVDLQGDGHLDVLAGTRQGPYVAFGDGTGLTPARPFADLPPARSGEPDLRMPLAAGDLTGDGIADYIYPEFLLLSRTNVETGALSFEGAHPKYGKPWTEAVIADLNGNGFSDAVALSRDALDIDFFNGSGSGSVNHFTIPTDHPAELPEVGDFDGDLLNDLVFMQRNSEALELDEVSIAFGRPAGAPEAPKVVARLDGVVQNKPLLNNVATSASDLLVSYRQSDAQGELGTAISLFVGSGDRSLPCPIEISNFAVDGTLESAIAFNVEVGAFVARGQRDLVAVAKTIETGEQNLWLLPDVSSGRASARALGWPLDPEFVLPDPEDPFSRLEVHLAAGDLDGDGLDELLAITPAASTSTGCVLTALSVGSEGSTRVLTRLELDASCSVKSDVRVVDLDGQGPPEVVLLTDGPEADIWVLWAGPGGALSGEDVASVAAGEQPRAVTAFRAMPGAPAALAYVTADSVLVRPLLPGLREFDAPAAAPLLLDDGTGVVAADVNGDGVSDLAVADHGNVRIWRSLLE